MPKPKLYIMIGLMGAGKSTHCNELKNQGVNIHSSDDIRMELFGTYDCMDKHKEVFETLYARVRSDLLNSQDCCIDATNLTHKSRRKAFSEIRLNKSTYDSIAIVLATPFNLCIERNANRDKKVPEYAIYRAREQFQFPLPNEFNRIDVIYEEDICDFDVNNLIEPTIGYNQNSPYHSLTLDKHLEETRNFLLYESHNRNVTIAGALHDVGKPIARKEEDGKIKYINHENISAYSVLTTLIYIDEYRDDIIEIVQLINNHMRPYTWKESYTVDKYRKMFGEKFFYDLMLLHEADKRAH